MQAKDLMTKAVLTVDKDERLETVLGLMRKHRVSKLVVTEKGAVVGVVTDGDIADELGAMKNRGVPASHLHASSAMRRRFATAAPEASLKTVLEPLLADDAGIVPVMHDRTCVGVVTASDFLALVKTDAPLADVMTAQLHVVAPTDRVIHARRLMIDHHVERLPVLDHGKLAGIVGEIDIAAGLARFKETVRDNHQPAALQRFLVEDVMQRTVVTATPETTARDAAKLMRERDVGSLPVLRGDRLAGIVTRSDLLKLLSL
ncbi:MAG TPA: CBS domain-containing protein [Candidatus Thermoplasmatota archaeon]|nr:CBS domain-containing protein [Candidatus Thermoplasmatota archaeon]